MRGEEVHAKHARTGRTTTTKTVGETPNSEEAHCPLNGTLSSTNNTVQLLNTNHRHAPIAPMYLLIYIFQCIESFHSSRFFFAMIITRSSYHPSFYLSPLPPRRRRRRPPTPAPTPPVALPAFTSFRPCRARPKETFTSQWHVLSFPDGASTSRRG